MDLNGIWDFAFFPDRSLEEIEPGKVVFTGVMPVPGCYEEFTSFRRGTGVYFRTFELEKEELRPVLRVEGAGQRVRFFLDGKTIMDFPPFPYSVMEKELPPLREGVHEIAALVDNRFDPEKLKLVRPDFDFFAFGGFFHGITLLFRTAPYSLDRVKVTPLDHRSGTVELDFVFSGNVPEKVELEYGFDGGKMTKVLLSPGEKIRCGVPDFKLWSPESPFLHTLSCLCNGKKIRESFGIRTLEVRGKDLLLNGKRLFLKGFNRHDSCPVSGAAVPADVMMLDLVHLKEMGCNFVRGAHYKQSGTFLELCDRMGILVWEESFGWQYRARELADPAFRDLVLEQTRMMVEEDFNHPSVIFWAFMNEFHSGSREGRIMTESLCSMIREKDPSRLVTFACSWIREDICCDLCDVIAFNTYPGWNEVSPDEPVQLLEEDLDGIIAFFRGKYPEKPLMVAEMGLCAEYGRRDPYAAQWTEEFQAEFYSAVIRKIASSGEFCGLTFWQLNDARSYLRKGAPLRVKPFGMNLAGVYDIYRRPKLAASAVGALFREMKF
ncbi:MAG: hypothetical protein J6A21_01935 [Lentisphaeria bacterium]|nr:hypothetical protein [Lentisphaeria bacterium]